MSRLPYPRSRRAAIASFALLFLVTACAESVGTTGPAAGPETEETLATFQSRYEVLFERRVQMSESDFANAYRSLASDFRTWNDRTGLVEAIVHEGEDCDVPQTGRALIDPNPNPGPTCAPCPAWPSNAPPGMICFLVEDSCDLYGNRSCLYHCYPIYWHGWRR